MEDKISQQAISRYSHQYCRKILDSFFAKKSFINGQELLHLTAVEQINLFIIQALFRTWKAELQKLRSPYFDYESEAVLAAQQNMMNVLSRNIKIDRQHLEPLLLQSVSQTLYDLLNPYDFFSKLITSNNNDLHLDTFKEELKYLKLNKAPLLRLSQILTERNIQKISGNEAFSILDKILEELNFTPEDIEPLLQQLSQVEPVKIDDFFEPSHKTQTPPAQSVNHPTHSKETKTLVDEFQKIMAIKDSLTINQKFMFTKALFNGDFEKFSETIAHLDKLSSFDEAINFLEKHLLHWDQESEEFHEFMEMVEKRFNE